MSLVCFSDAFRLRQVVLEGYLAFAYPENLRSHLLTSLNTTTCSDIT